MQNTTISNSAKSNFDNKGRIHLPSNLLSRESKINPPGQNKPHLSKLPILFLWKKNV